VSIIYTMGGYLVIPDLWVFERQKGASFPSILLIIKSQAEKKKINFEFCGTTQENYHTFFKSLPFPQKHQNIFRCKRGDGKCSLRLHLRNNCPHCRLMKCQSSGMKAELVLSKYPNSTPDSHEQQSKSFIKNIEIISIQKGIINDETLILSEINLACVPPILLTELDRKIRNHTGDLHPDIFLVSQMELAFLKAKQSVTYLVNQIIEQDQVATQQNIFFITQVVIKGQLFYMNYDPVNIKYPGIFCQIDDCLPAELHLFPIYSCLLSVPVVEEEHQ